MRTPEEVAAEVVFGVEEEALVRTMAESLGLWEGRRRARDALHQINQEVDLANAWLAEAAERKDGLLVASRAASDALVARPEPVSVRSVLDTVLEDLDDTVAEVRPPIGPDLLLVDPRHLEQILVNLLTNATEDGEPPITVTTVDAGKGRVRLEVVDHGPGVPADLQQRTWDRLDRRDRGDARTASGTGLGLAIITLLTATNRGSVGYRDAVAGAVFSVELPSPDPG